MSGLARCRLKAGIALLASGIAVLGLPAAIASASPVGKPDAVMILLDVDQSPFVNLLSDERSAALSFASALPSGVQAGLIIFSNHWKLVLAPTADRARLAAALAAVTTEGSNSRGLSRAISGAAAALAASSSASGSRLLVLSQGEDIKHPLTLGQIATDVLTWSFDPDDNVLAVRALAAATGGRTGNPADAGRLASIFAGPASPTPARSTAAASARPETSAGTVHRASTPAWLMAAVFFVTFLLALMGIGALRQGDRGRRRLEQIAQYGSRSHASRAGPAHETKAASAALRLTNSFLRSSNAEPRLAARLDLAGIARRPAEWALLGVSATVLLIAALVVATGNALVGVLVGALCGWIGGRLILSIRISRRRTAFTEQLPDMLQLIAGSLQAGFSLPQALDGVTREGTQPSAGEVARALAEARIGADLEDALSGVAERMDSNDMRWTVMAIRIQREVGGNLAEVLRNTIDTMRERAYLRRHVRSLSGEGRLSAYILIAIPIVLGVWLFYSSPTYMRPLYTTPPGLIMLAGAGVLFVLGVLWMRVLIKVEV